MIHTFEQQASTGTGPIRPSRYWYLIAGGLLAAAVTCLTVAVIGMFSWDRQIQDFQRVPVPGQGEITLTQPGEYVLYVETRGACCSWTVGSQDGPLATWWRLGRCSAELAALGPPTAQLRQVHRLAVRACQGFEQGARYYAATARFMGPDGAPTDQDKVTKLLDRGDACVNRGSNLMSDAVVDGSFIGSPG